MLVCSHSLKKQTNKLVKVKSRWPASQPADCQQCSFLRNQSQGGGGGGRGGHRHTYTQRQREGCTRMHMNTRAHTYQNEHAWAVTCARTHWYLSTSQSQFFSFFLGFFMFLFLKWGSVKSSLPPPQQFFWIPLPPKHGRPKDGNTPSANKVKKLFFSVYMFLSNNFHITWKKWKTRN